MQETDLKIFTYGTLKPGQANYDLYCRGKYSNLMPGYIIAELYDLPTGYPAAIEGYDLTQGVLYNFTEKAHIEAIDALEGYNKQNAPEKNLYYKKQVAVYSFNNEKIATAAAYFMTYEKVFRYNGTKLKYGSWKRRI